MFSTIGLITNNGIKTIQPILDQLAEYLQNKQRHIILDPCCARLLHHLQLQSCSANEIGKHCDLVIAIGGDGTMLMASHLLCHYETPLLGINTGRIGFLSDIPADNITTHLDDILNGRYIEDVRFLLSGQVLRHDHCVHKSYAFNDIVIQKWNIARLMEIKTYINDAFVHTHRSDGMIISTPTGSTAYALAGGGPVVHPSLDALLLVPICPHSLANRPIVIDGNNCVDVIIGTRETDQARLTYDGEIKCKLAPGDRVRVTKKDKKICLIHPLEHDQFHILREKLHWSK